MLHGTRGAPLANFHTAAHVNEWSAKSAWTAVTQAHRRRSPCALHRIDTAKRVSTNIDTAPVVVRVRKSHCPKLPRLSKAWLCGPPAVLCHTLKCWTSLRTTLCRRGSPRGQPTDSQTLHPLAKAKPQRNMWRTNLGGNPQTFSPPPDPTAPPDESPLWAVSK